MPRELSQAWEAVRAQLLEEFREQVQAEICEPSGLHTRGRLHGESGARTYHTNLSNSVADAGQFVNPASLDCSCKEGAKPRLGIINSAQGSVRFQGECSRTDPTKQAH